MPILKKKTLRYKKIAITTGDPSGIGFEVSAKALAQLSDKEKKNCLFFLFRDHKQESIQKKYFTLLDSRWLRLTFHSLDVAFDFVDSFAKVGVSLPNNILIDLSLTTTADDWVVKSVVACKNNQLDGLVTAPLSKTLIKKSGRKEIGHTGIFKTFFPKANLHMGFIGNDFNVLLVTDHIALSQVSKKLTPKSLALALQSVKILQKVLSSSKKVAVLGLNPHAGEGGLLGLDEKKLFKNLPSWAEGPLVPDAAFLKKNWKQYSLFVCLYHDQGLIPFKMHHGQDSGVHITLGLPFVRTSVDHGTASDIFNKNIANPASMLEAILLNSKLLST